MTTVHALTLPTPAGDFTALYDPETGALHAGGFGPADALAARLAPGDACEPGGAKTAAAAAIRAAVAAYVDGDLTALDAIAVAQPGGDFMQRAWAALRRVAPGETITYSEFAARAGNPKAVRAAGSACARNRVALFVPCHRIVRTDGSLGGYQYGLPVKRWLLAHERGEQAPLTA